MMTTNHGKCRHLIQRSKSLTPSTNREQQVLSTPTPPSIKTRITTLPATTKKADSTKSLLSSVLPSTKATPKTRSISHQTISKNKHHQILSAKTTTSTAPRPKTTPSTNHPTTATIISQAVKIPTNSPLAIMRVGEVSASAIKVGRRIMMMICSAHRGQF